MSSQKLSWGILSTASIGIKNAIALQKSNSSEIKSISSRDIKKAQETAKERRIPNAQTHDDLIVNKEIECIYNPMPTSVRSEWTSKCLKSGKHVLFEKPAANSLEELDNLIKEASSKNLMMMDGLMFQHSKRLKLIQEQLKCFGNGARHCYTSFCFPLVRLAAPTEIRLNKQLEPFGCLGDLGWYTIRMTLVAYNFEMPKQLMCHTQFKNDVPIDSLCTMWFEKGTAQFHVSNIQAFEQQCIISGDEKRIILEDFVIPNDENHCEFRIEQSNGLIDDARRIDNTGMKFIVETDKPQECQMFNDFNEAILSNNKNKISECRSKWMEYTRKTQYLLDLCVKSSKSDGQIVKIDWESLK